MECMTENTLTQLELNLEQLQQAGERTLTPSGLKSSKFRAMHPNYRKEWNEKNRDKLNAQARDYQKKNRKNGNAAMQRWRDKNREHVRAYQRQDRLQKIERYKERAKRTRIKHHDKILLKMREWKERNPGWHHDYVAKNRERINAYMRAWNKTNVNRQEKQAIGQQIRYGAAQDGWLYRKWEALGKLCYICGEMVEQFEISIDHVIPFSKGGGHDPSNLMPTHPYCNAKKSNKLNYPVARPDLVEATV